MQTSNTHIYIYIYIWSNSLNWDPTCVYMYIWISLSPKIHISKKGMKQLGKGVVPLPLPHLPGLLVQKFFRWPPTCAHDLGIWGLWRSLNWKGKTKIAGWLSGHVWAKFQFWSEEDDLCLISWYRSWFQHTLSNLYIFVVELTTKESIYIYIYIKNWAEVNELKAGSCALLFSAWWHRTCRASMDS